MRMKIAAAIVAVTFGAASVGGLAAAPSGKKGVAAKKSCLAALKRKAAAGDGQAAKKLAIYFGDESAPQVNPAAALNYLKVAIATGTDVSDVAHASSRDVIAACEAERPSVPVAAPTPAVVAPVQESGAGMQESSVPAAPDADQAQPSAAANGKAQRERLAAAVPPPSPAVIELEKRAANAEWRGKMREAVKYWERARDGGSRPAAKRLYQIYSFGSGDVEADYLKAIEAAKIAQSLGLAVPELPRK